MAEKIGTKKLYRRHRKRVSIYHYRVTTTKARFLGEKFTQSTLMRRAPLSDLQVSQCRKLAALRKRLGLSQPELAKALGHFTDCESCSRGRLANWEYLKAPIPTGIWKKLPVIFAKALEAKRAELSAAIAALGQIQEEWTSEASR